MKHDGYQCGYCTSGQICSAVAVLDEIKAGPFTSTVTLVTTGSSVLAACAAETAIEITGHFLVGTSARHGIAVPRCFDGAHAVS